MELPILDFEKTMSQLPPQQPADGLDEAIRQVLAERYDVVIVLDDDPTGTQTVYDVPVITEWTVEALIKELKRGEPLFYLLTNSRAWSSGVLEQQIRTIGKNIRKATDALSLSFITIIRGDSTLRGHYPLEEAVLSYATGFEHVPHFLIPAFFEGGRYTLGDIHYVKEEDNLIPAAQTPFAKDKSFGYTASHLKAWVEEKTGGGIKIEEVISLSVADLRKADTANLRDKLTALGPEGQCIVNAADYIDLKRAALAILRFTKFPLIRSSASFIRALLGQPDRPLLKLRAKGQKRGGLLVVGSHVPKTTAQLSYLLANHDVVALEVDVPMLLQGPEFAAHNRFLGMVEHISKQVAAGLANGQDVVLYTSRKVITAASKEASLQLSLQVSSFLEQVVAKLESAPAFLLTKGGITSSRIATKSLGIKRALALGQVQPGVPTWELGPESKFPGMPFIIFPGNVGDEQSLSYILKNTIV
ncbi:MAG: four-carbon acid sugar kinase family protein [Bacteroidota bacterium]